MNRSVGLPGAVDTWSHRQSPAQTAMDIRVNGDHTPFTPFPPLGGAPGWR
jgi:hypothetical protein